MDLETLTVSFGADLAGLTSGISGAKVLLAGFGAGIVGVGIMAVKAAGDWQSGLTSLVTGAGEASKNLGMVSSGMLKMATDTGTSTTQLEQGMYLIESAGYHGATGLQVLQAAAEGAKVGNSDLATVANGVTTAMTDYAASGLTASQATNDLIATVSNGKTTMADLSASMASILPTASAVGVSLTDTSGAMATMTGEGVPAADAATYLRQTLMSLENPSKSAADTLASIGLKSSDVSDEMKKSLPDALAMITDALAKKFPVGSAAYNAALAQIAGGTRQMQGMLDLTGSHLSVFKSDVENIGGAVTKGGNSIVGWSNVQQDFNFKIQQAQAAFQTLMITLGSKLLPLLSPLIGDVTNVANAFMGWMNSAHPLTDALSLTGKYSQIVLPILAGLGAMVLAVLVPAFATWAVTTLIATWPILAIGAAVAGLVAIFVHFYQTNAGFKTFIDNLANGFKQVGSFIAANFMPTMKTIGDFLKQNVLPILQNLGSFLVSTFQPVWQNLVNLWNGQLLPLFKQIWNAIQPIIPVFQLIGAVIAGIVVVAFVELVGIVHGVISAVATVISDIGSAIGGVVQVITGIIQVVSGIIRIIKDIFTGNFSDLGAALGQIWQGIVNIFGGIFQVLGSIVHAIFGGIFAFIGGFIAGILSIFTGFKGSAQDVWNAIGKAIGNAFSAVGTFFHNIWSGIEKFFSSIPGWFKNLFQTAWNNIIGVFQDIGKFLMDMWTKEVQGWQNIGKWFQDRFTEAWNAVTSVFQHIGQFLMGLWNKEVTGWENIGSWFKDRFTEAWNNITSVFGGIGNWFHNLWTNITNDFSNVFSGLKNTVTNIFNSVTGAVKGVFNGIIDAINGVINRVDSIKVAGFGVSIPDIPHLAGGGIVPPGGAAVAGETGKPEIVLGGMHGATVVGVSQTAALMAGGGNAPIENHVHVYFDGRELTQQIGMNMLSMARAHGAVGGSR